MKLKHLLTIAALSCFGGNLWADDVFKDVTSTYLTNADFEGDYSVYKYPRGENNKDRAIYLPSGWTIKYENGKEWDMTVLTSKDLAYNSFSSVPSLSTGGSQTFRIRFNNSYTSQRIELSQKATLPEGTYQLTVDWYISRTDAGDGYIKIGDKRTNASVASTWQVFSQSFTSTGKEMIFTCGAYHSATTEKFYAFDNFKLERNLTQSLVTLIASATSAYETGGSSDAILKAAIDDADAKKSSSDADELEQAYNDLTAAAALAIKRKAWNDAKSAANGAIADEAYSSVTGEEKTALQDEIGKTEPTTGDGYDVAKAALEEATSTFMSAKVSYDRLVTERANGATYTSEKWPYASTAKRTALDSALAADEPTNAEDADAKASAIVTAYRLYVESNGKAEGVAVAVDYTSYITNAACDNLTGWNVTNTSGNDVKVTDTAAEKYTDGEGNLSGKYFDGGWSTSAVCNKTVSQTITLPAGQYLLQITARSNCSTYTLTVGENSPVELPKDAATNGTFGRGWSDVYTVFESTGEELTISVNALGDQNQTWMSFNRIRLTKLDATLADTDDYAALSDAIAEAEGKAIGFDVNEYAPYNNTLVLSQLAAAKAIDPNVNNVQADVQSATTALTSYTWVKNTEELNAFYDGGFSEANEDDSTPLDVAPAGWTKSGNMRLMLKNTTKYPGITETNSTSAMMSWSDGATYGEQAGYEMPLAAHTLYELTVKVAGWGTDGKGAVGAVSISVLKGDQGIKTISLGGASSGPGVAYSFVEKKMLFATEDAGNYIFKISANGNFSFTDLALYKASNQYLEFVDGSLPTYAPGTYPTVKISRTLSADKWATAVYPFAVSGVDNIAVIDSYDKATGALGFKSATASEANVPFLMRSTAGATEITLTDVEVVAAAATDATASEASLKGTYATTKIDNTAKNYVLSNNQIFSVGEAGATVNPYRAYIQIDQDAAVKALTFFVDGKATAIEGVNAESKVAGEIYNLAGQRVNKAQKGIYVVNGKKIAVK